MLINFPDNGVRNNNNDNNAQQDASHLVIEEGELAAAPEHFTTRSGNRDKTNKMLESLLTKKAKAKEPSGDGALDEATAPQQDYAKVVALLKQIDKKLAGVSTKVDALGARLTAVEALHSSQAARNVLEARFRKDVRGLLRKDDCAALKQILFVERIKQYEKSETWWLWLGGDWQQSDKDALGDSIVSLMRELVRKERTHLADQVRSEIQRTYSAVQLAFPGAGAKPTPVIKEEVAAWEAALDAAGVPGPEDLGDYLEAIASATVAVFGAAARMEDLVFCVWIFQHWRRGKSLAQTSASTPYKSWYDCYVQLKEGEEHLHEALQNAMPSAMDEDDNDDREQQEANDDAQGAESSKEKSDAE